jgi:primosomal protein N' (replication factor Y)
MKKIFADVAVELPVEGSFTYSVPEGLMQRAAPGMRSLVPFGKRTVTGYILSLDENAPHGLKAVRPIADILDNAPVFDEKRLRFYRWLSAYYFAPLGMALGLMDPGGLSVRSRRRIALTEDGEKALSTRDGLAAEVLRCAGAGADLGSVVRRLRGRPVYSVVSALKDEGLLREDTLLSGGVKESTEEFIEYAGPDNAVPADIARRSPIQAKVLRRLIENGAQSLKEVTLELGNVRASVKRLEARGLVNIARRLALRDPLSAIVPKAPPTSPNREQKAAIDEISSALREGSFAPFLLYGVTGSGKTLVYIKAVEEALRAGRRALYLVPEISLAPWPAAYLSSSFPGRVALYHSGLSGGERADEWRRILGGAADVVVGARSALFAPIRDLGLIIVDEEHETSYKQEEGVRYNARDASLMLGKSLGIPVVLGSATPSVETFHNASTGKLRALRLTKRVEDRALPRVEVVDLRTEKGAVLTERLKDLLSGALDSKGQTLLFLNRRGFARSVLCRDCGRVFECLNCSVPLVMHKGQKELRCHYCGFSAPLPDECPGCRGVDLVNPGVGTEKVEEETRRIFAGARIGRMDRDTTRRKGAAKRIIDAVEDKSLDILIGTQMASKGHHFPGMTLVGVVSGDSSLNIPDFRSSERTFQLITQAAGRAGRGDAPGAVVIQTLNPEHYCFKSAASHDYDGFFAEEIEKRREAGYPPFTRLCAIRLEGVSESRVIAAAGLLKRLSGRLHGVTVLGPTPALIPRLKGRYRYQMLVKGDVKGLLKSVEWLRRSFEQGRLSGVRLITDMDPLTTI